MPKVLTTCIYCGCGCGLYLETDKKRVTGSSPSYNHPVSAGALCVKGWNCYEFVNNPDRLETPLLKKNGTFKKSQYTVKVSFTSPDSTTKVHSVAIKT